MKMFLQYLATNVPRLAKRSHERTIKLAWSFIKVPLSPATWLKSPRFTSSPVQPIEVCLPIIPLRSETTTRSDILQGQALFTRVNKKILFHLLTTERQKRQIVRNDRQTKKIERQTKKIDRQRDRTEKTDILTERTDTQTEKTNIQTIDRDLEVRICTFLFITTKTKWTISFNWGKISAIALE